MNKPAQNPFIPLLVGGLVTVLIVALLSVFVWVWAVRRPVSTASFQTQDAAPDEVRPLIYAAIGASSVIGMGDGDSSSWVDILHEKMPQGTRLVRLGTGETTLQEVNQGEIPAAIQAQPDVVTLWCVVNDATAGVPLKVYIKELYYALTRLTKETSAKVILLNLQDITVTMQDLPAEREALIRGGVEQWNRAIAEAAARYGERVCVVDLFPISREVLVNTVVVAALDNAQPTTAGSCRLAEIVWQAIEQGDLLKRQ